MILYRSDDGEGYVAPEPEVSEVEEVPAWDFTPPEPQPNALTLEAIEKLIDSKLAPQKEADWEETVVNNAVERATQQMSAMFSSQMAPLARMQFAQELTQGMPQNVTQGMMNYLSQYDANGIASLRNDAATMQILKLAAKGMAGDKPSVPQSNPSHPSVKNYTSGVSDADIKKYAANFGISEADARKWIEEFEGAANES